MGCLTLLFSSFVFVLLVPYRMCSTNCGLEDKLELLINRVEQLEEKNLELQLDNSQLKMRVSKKERQANESSPNSYNIFDCHLTENWSTEGIIVFNGCSGKNNLHALRIR